MPITRLYLSYRNIKRLKQIVTVFIRYGFYPLAERLRLHKLVSFPERLRLKRLGGEKEKEVLSLSVRFRKAFEELGPTFIKLGQVLSTRPDIIPEDFIEEFIKFQDKVPPFSFDKAMTQIEREFNRPPLEVFKEIDRVPVASASIAQVHKALLTDGTEVVVKIQRPDIEDVIRTDLAILRYLARLIVRYIPESELYDPMGMVEEFSRAIEKEMDFTLEGSYTERFRRNFEKDERVVVPKVFWDLTSKRVLTLERIKKGIKVDDIVRLKKSKIDTVKISHLMADIFFKQVFDFGLFHGDLHAGNIFVLGSEKIALVDFGIVGRIDTELAENLADIFIGIIKEDYDLILKVYLRMGILEEGVDVETFKRDYQDLLLHYFGRPFKTSKLGELLMGYIKVAARYRLRVPRDILLLNKCLFELEGLAKILCPEIDIIKEGLPFAEGLLKSRFSPKKLSMDFVTSLQDYHSLARLFPLQINQILRKMSSDNFTVDFVHKGLEEFITEMDRSSNRLTVGLIVSALIVGSSLTMLPGVGGPYLFGLPVLGFIGFALAGFLGIWLAFLILRSGRF